MQVAMNKCFLLNPENNLAQIRLVVFEKTQKMHTLIPKNDVTEPKAMLLYNRLKDSFKLSQTMVSGTRQDGSVLNFFFSI